MGYNSLIKIVLILNPRFYGQGGAAV